MITPYIPAILFYVFAATTIILALFVVFFKNPVHAVLSLIGVFVFTAGLWILMHAEFLALLLVFLYVGAVMTLFLFVVMMLNVDLSAMSDGLVRYFVTGIIVALAFFDAMFFMLGPHYFSSGHTTLSFANDNANNLEPLAMLMFTKYIYAFEMTGVLLLLAIIAAVGLVFNGKRRGTKAQSINKQLSASKSSRLSIVDMESSK